MILTADLYRVHDAAPWVVLVHGAGGSSVLWYRQLRTFRARFNVILLDLRGHGRSAEGADAIDDKDYTFRSVAQDVIETLDHHGVRRAHFVGLSLGSTIVRVLADGWPDRMSTMVLGGAIVRFNLRARILMWIGRTARWFIPYMWLYRLFAWIIMPGSQHQLSRQLFAREARALGQREFIRWFRMTSEVVMLMERLASSPPRVPALYLTGDADYMFLPEVRRIMAHHSDATLTVVPDSGHVCNVERPDIFNEATIRFVNEHASSK